MKNRSLSRPTENSALHDGACRMDGCNRPQMVDFPSGICQHHAVKIAAAMAEWFRGEHLNFAERALTRGDHYAPVVAPAGPQVYYVRVGDHIKVGFSIKVAERVKTYQTGNARVELLACELAVGRGLENERHRRFDKSRVPNRRELFNPTPDLIDHINTIRALTQEQPLVWS